MDTSLQQQLKDAGYTGEFDLAPLVEACGDGFNSLERGEDEDGNDYWLARRWGDNAVDGSGSSPEEAVAMLWLALNKK